VHRRRLFHIEPAFWAVHIWVVAPDIRVTVEGVDRHADHRSCGEETATDNEAACAEEYHNTQILTSRGLTFGNYTWEAKCNGREDAQSLFDASVEVRKVLHLLACCHGVVIHPVLIKLLLETRLNSGISRKMVDDNSD
jgi:hypothetical protein